MAPTEFQTNYPPDIRIPQQIKYLRNNARLYLSTALEKKLIPAYQEIGVFRPKDGVRSAVYLARLNIDVHIIKLSIFDQTDNWEALRSWRESGITTPPIITNGQFSCAEDTPIYYLVMDFIEGENGNHYLDKHPEQTSSFGYRAGKMLRQMHQVVPEKNICGGIDIGHAFSTDDLVKKLVQARMEILASLGIDARILQRFLRYMTAVGPQTSTWVHNDFAPHNLIVKDVPRLNLTVIDPNAFVGDPYWDLANAKNRLLWVAKRLAKNPEIVLFQHQAKKESLYYPALVAGYEQGKPLDEERLLAQQIAQLLWKVTSTAQDEAYQTVELLKQIFDIKLELLKELLTNI